MTKIKNIILFFSVFTLAACSSLNTKNSPPKENNANQKLANIDLQLGFEYLDKMDIPAAKQKFLAAIDKAPDYSPVWYSMGYFQEATNNKKLAETYYRKAVKLAPENGEVNNNYGTFLCRNNEYDAGIDHFLIAANDRNYTAVGAAFENAGLCALKIPDTTKAKEFFLKSLSEDPSREGATLELARIFYFEKNATKAKLYLDRYNAMSTQHVALSLESFNPRARG